MGASVRAAEKADPGGGTITLGSGFMPLPTGCRKTLREEKPRRVPAATAAGIKSKFVISGDMRLGNDTSHGGRGDFFARKRTPSAMWPFSKKRHSRFFDTLWGVALCHSPILALDYKILRNTEFSI